MAWFDRFKRKRPEPAKIGQKRLGHRGIAIGSAKEKDLSAENVAKWKMLSGDEVEDFVHWNQPLFVHSTCVAMAQFFPDDNALLIEYLPSQTTGEGAGAYKYGNIPEEMAYNFAQAQSKGIWVWDNLRIRGTKYGHREPYWKIW